MRNVSVDIDPENVLDQLDAEDIVKHIGFDILLDEIGIKECLHYFRYDIVTELGASFLLDEIDDSDIRKYANDELDMVEAKND
jgi:hypothetical protein